MHIVKGSLDTGVETTNVAKVVSELLGLSGALQE